MEPDHWARVQRIFSAAVELSEAERDAFLARECGGDAALEEEVRSLLEADIDDHSLLDAGAAKAADELGLLEETSRTGQRIGPWKLTETIGRGGMGAVYLAERADGEFEQRVALKLIKRGMDSEEILARFRGERQILARLDHPNIARFLDGGLRSSRSTTGTSDGWPGRAAVSKRPWSGTARRWSSAAGSSASGTRA